MSTATKPIELTRYLSEEEQDEILDAADRAFEQGERDRGLDILRQLPLRPGIAEVLRQTFSPEYMRENFNLYDANQKLGEGWING